ncbi:MAG: cyclic nucleotide-binding domain-containing protein [Pseudomonadota bacterium]
MKSPPAERQTFPAMEQFVSHCRRREVPARAIIIRADDTPDSLYFLRSGSVEVVINDDSGHEMVLAYLNPGHFFGEMGFFDGGTRRTAWVRARTDCEIAEMTYPEFRQLATTSPELVIELATQLAIRLARTNMKIGDLAFLDVTGRVAHALIDLANEPEAIGEGASRRVKVTRPQLARLVGCSREMVSRVLKALQQQGLIYEDDDGIVVLDESAAQAPYWQPIP